MVGTGYVGATAGYALVMSGVGREVVLGDKNTACAEAEAEDFPPSCAFAHPLDGRTGVYEASSKGQAFGLNRATLDAEGAGKENQRL
jgi:malate/lactate dehydrogenase